MIEFEQLIHLIAFDEYKTLSRAAKELHISQPVLTRSMQKLEETLDLTLFERTKNRMYLNATGLLAVELAKRFGGDASGSFVNGVLGKIASEKDEKKNEEETADTEEKAAETPEENA